MEKIKNFEIEMVDITKIKLDKENPNIMDKDKMKALEKIMKEKGMLQPILIDQESNMIDGEHRFLVYKKFEMDKIPCFRMNATDVERRLLRQTMNKIRGSHDPRKDIEELVKMEKAFGTGELSKYLGVEKRYLEDFLSSKEQVPESYLNLIIKEKKEAKKEIMISLKLTEAQTKNLLSKLGDLKIQDVALIPVDGLLIK